MKVNEIRLIDYKVKYRNTHKTAPSFVYEAAEKLLFSSPLSYK